MWVPFMYIFLLIFTLLFGIEMDVAHTLKTKVLLQSAMDASTLAGAIQNHMEVYETNGDGAPIDFGWFLDDNNNPELMAQQAWQKNIASFTAGIGQGTMPQFQRTPDNKGMTGVVMQTVQETMASHVMEG